MNDRMSPVGRLLREWRGARGLSQLDLALDAGVSSRHISFIETGRSSPSREMVLRLVDTLGLSLRDRNAALEAAGYVAAYRERSLTDSAVAPVRRALSLILDSHEPYPAFVLDASWTIVQANRAHERTLEWMLPDASTREGADNAARLVLDPQLLRPLVDDWSRVANVLGHRIRRELSHPRVLPQTAERLEALIDLPGVRDAMRDVIPPPESDVLIPLRFLVDGRRLSWFSTIATIGTPQDVTLEELRIESLFPADEATEAIAKAERPGSRA